MKYTVMCFDMPEYNTGDCWSIEKFSSFEQALMKRLECEEKNTNDNVFYHIVVDV